MFSNIFSEILRFMR